MNIFSSLLLGLIQGLTEFLPVSSSGHLVIAQQAVPGFSQPGVMLDVILHLATTLAVILYFRRVLVHYYKKYLLQIIIASIPAALFGYLFQDFFEGLFSSLFAVGMALIVTGAINYLADKAKSFNRDVGNRESLIIGIAQALAITPGISRSGATIFAASALGIPKSDAAQFSFLISVPAVLGANLLQVVKYRGELGEINLNLYVVGFIVSLVVGYLSIRLLFTLLTKDKYRYFAYYAFIVGLLLIFI